MRARQTYDTVICFGDSLTQQASGRSGFVGLVQDAYQRRLDVVSRGFSGYTSRQALALCPYLFDTQSLSDAHSNDGRARLATVWFGTNDCIAPGYSQHVPISEYKQNMRTVLVDYFSHIDTLLITPATVVHGRFEGHEDDETMVQYGNCLKELADELTRQRAGQKHAKKLIVVDMHKIFCDESAKRGGPETLFVEDGLHIAQDGYKIVFEGIMAAIQKHLSHLTPDALPLVFPAWQDLDLSKDVEGQRVQLKPK